MNAREVSNISEEIEDLKGKIEHIDFIKEHGGLYADIYSGKIPSKYFKSNYPVSVEYDDELNVLLILKRDSLVKRKAELEKNLMMALGGEKNN